MVTYLPRILAHVLANRLATVGAVVVEGVKACGKTGTARAVAGSEVLFEIASQPSQTRSVGAATRRTRVEGRGHGPPVHLVELVT